MEPEAAAHLVTGDHHGSFLDGDGNCVTGKEAVLANLVGLIEQHLGMAISHIAHVAGDIGIGHLDAVLYLKC